MLKGLGITGVALVAMVWCISANADWNVMDFGANGDGQADNTAAFQNALNAAFSAGGGTVNVPAGHFRFAGTITIPGSVTLKGTFTVPATTISNGGPRPGFDGTVLMAYAGRGNAEGASFIQLAGHMAVVTGVMVIYPEWKQTDVPPVPYPPTIACNQVEDTGIYDCQLVNSYEGIRFTGAARFIIRNVFGYPSYRGLYIDDCFDIGRVENCHFWPFNTAYNPDDPYSKWVNVNGVAFEFARTDWQYCSNTFCFGYGVGYKFSTSKNGSCNGNFSGIGADSCRRAVLVDTAPGTIDLLITNGEFVGRWAGQDSVGVEVTGQTTQRVSLTNCAFWGPLDKCIWVNAPDAQLTAMACGFNMWDVGGTGAPAILSDTGKLNVQGCSFMREGLHVRIGEKVQSAILLGNQAGNGLRVENLAGARTQLLANETATVAWTKDALRHYQIVVGDSGDSRYLSGCHGPEAVSNWPDGGPMRWLGPKTRLDLPVKPHCAYTLTLDLFLPEPSIDPANGVFLGGKRLAALPDKPGPALVDVRVPAQAEDHLTLHIKTKGWTPKQVNPGSDDTRELAASLRGITMKAKRAPKKIYNANTGAWVLR